MAKLFRGFFTKSIKCNYFIKVHEVTLPGLDTIGDNDRFNVSFERGDRLTFGTDQSPSFDYSGDTVDVAIEFDETLALDVTLYADASGVYQEKDGLIAVLQRKKGALGLRQGKEGFKSVGSVKLLLSGDYSNGQPHDVTLPLQWCAAVGATIKMTITCNHLEGKPQPSSNNKKASAPSESRIKTESGYDASEMEDMFTLPTSRPKSDTRKSDEYVPWGDDEEEITASNPWEHEDHTASTGWDQPTPPTTAADHHSAFDEPDLTGNEDDPFAPSPAAANVSTAAAAAATTKVSAYADDFSASMPTVDASRQKAADAYDPDDPFPSPASDRDVFSSFSGSSSAAPSPVDPAPKKTSAPTAAPKVSTEAPSRSAQPASDSGSPTFKEIYATSYRGDPSQPVVRFKLTLPRDVKPGDTIKNIGGNSRINAVVPPNCRGGDTVILVLPEDFNNDSDGVSQKVAAPSLKATAPSNSAAPSSSSSSSSSAPRSSVGNDEYLKLQSVLKDTQARLQESEAKGQATAEAFAAYRDKMESELQRVKAKQAATESMVSMASSQINSSSEDDQASKAEVSNLKAELAALREKNSMLEALGAKASYMSSQVSEYESIVAAIKEELDKAGEEKLALEVRVRELDAESGTLHQQVLDSKLSLVQLAAEADEAKRNSGVFKARAQALATKVASMEVAIVEAELMKAEMSNNNGHAEAKAPPMPSFLKKIAAAPAPAPAAAKPVVVPTPVAAPVPAVIVAPPRFTPSPLTTAAPTATSTAAAGAPPRPNFAAPSMPLPVAGLVRPSFTTAHQAPTKPTVAPAVAPASSALESRVRKFYEHFNPAKVSDVPSILNTWRGRETELIKNLEAKYGSFPDEQNVEDEGDLC